MKSAFVAVVAVALAGSGASGQDGDRRFTSVQEALQSSGRLGGATGPASVNWIEAGRQFSYTIRNAQGEAEVRVFDPEGRYLHRFGRRYGGGPPELPVRPHDR